MKIRTILLLLLFATIVEGHAPAGKTEVLNWPNGKRAAISITFDDGTENQFKVALPILQKLHLPATFFIITGEVQSSRYKASYSGRSFEEILHDATTRTTNEQNFFERATALKFSGYDPNGDLHMKVGEVFEEGKIAEAYQLIDEAFAKIRKGEMKREPQQTAEGPMSWDDFRRIAKSGYEFASHTVSHPYLSVLDDANVQYELEKSRDEIREQLGEKHTFSIECPFGTEDLRTIQSALKIYQLARNWMPDEGVHDLNRWDDQDPGTSQKKYVRWQRGALSDTSLDDMKGWVDKIRQSYKVWLVLVFHGVDGIGWEPQPGAHLETYFQYIQAQDDIWVATFQDVGKYIRESLYTQASAKPSEESIEIDLANRLDRNVYDLRLTLKTYVPDSWKAASIESGETFSVQRDKEGTYIIFNAVPNSGPILLRKVN